MTHTPDLWKDMQQAILPESDMNACFISLPLVIRNIMITPNLWLGQDVLPGLFFLLKGQQLCVALPLLLDGGLSSCFFLLFSVKNAATTSVITSVMKEKSRNRHARCFEQKFQVCVCRFQHEMLSAFVVLLPLLTPCDLLIPDS